MVDRRREAIEPLEARIAPAFAAVVELSGLTGDKGFKISGGAAGDQSGFSTSEAGDINGDGIDDLLVSAKFADANGSASGASYVVFGSRDGLPANLNLSALTGANGFKISGVAASDESGSSVSAAGDINGDGIDDLLIGAPGAAPNGADSGASYVVFGSRAGFAANLNLSALTGPNGFKISGVAAGDYSGFSVSAAGDVNGDGIDDLLIGAYGADLNGSNSGASYVVFGSRTAFTANLNLSALTGANGFKISGAAGIDLSGRSVSAAGDVNGDGIDDLLIGAYGADPNGLSSGASYVVFGSRTPFAANLNVSALTGANGFKISGVAADDRAGFSVSAAGDVNGDGIDDLLIGAPGAGPNGDLSGASYVVFGSRAPFAANLNLSALTGANGFKISGVAAFDYAGRSVSAAGDVNGDGIDDILIGAHAADPNGSGSGASYVIFGSHTPFAANLNLSALTGANGFEIRGVAAGDHAGFSVSKAGDVNGDGIDDLIIGAPNAGSNGANSGASYVLYGQPAVAPTEFSDNINLSALSGPDGFQISGAAAFDYAGRSVSNAGDINGDGIDDFLVGAFRADPNGFSSGASYVVFGKSTPFAQNLNLAGLTGANGFKISGVAAGDYAGFSVSAAGDINGDGIDDLLIGARGANANGKFSGASYVVFGHSTPFAANLNLSTLTGPNGFKISGAVGYDFSGVSVKAAGDINGDGIDDLVIGAYGADPNGSASGASYVVFGSHTPFAANLNLSTLTGATGFKISGVAAGDNSGRSVSAAGDINGDGIDDLLIGAFRADPNGYSSGASYVLFGSRTPFAANVNLESLDGNNGFKISGVAAGDYAGFSVSAAGDINGDGIDDLVIGARGASANGKFSGASYVVFGSRTPFAANLNLSALTGANGFKISGAAGYDFSGVSVSGAGDINGDGIDDLIIGAYGADPNGSASGASYVVFGSRTPFAANFSLSGLTGSNGFKISGFAAGDSSGRAVSAAGDVNGDGVDDLIVGAEGADLNGSNSGAAYVIFGHRAPVPNVEVTVAGSPATEGDGTGLVYTFTRTSNSSAPLTIHFTKTGTTSAGDFNATSSSGTFDFAAGTVTIPANETFATVTLTPVDDRSAEGTETAILTITAGSGYTPTGTAATGTIADNDTAIISFASGQSAGAEDVANFPLSLVLTVLDSGTTGTPMIERSVTFNVTTAGGTATGGGTDYTLPSVVTFAAGTNTGATLSANLTVVNDSFVEGSETALLGLALDTDNNGGQVTVAPAASHTATISDEDAAVIGFSAPNSSVAEGTAADTLGFTLNITPGAGSTGPAALARDVTFNVTATGGTATGAGTDYTLPTTVTFVAGSLNGATTTADLAIINDAVVEGGETAILGLALNADGTGGQVAVSTGTTASHTATITDNDTATIGYAAGASFVGEGSATHPLSFVLTINANGSGTPTLGRDVTFSTTGTGGTATLGTDLSLSASGAFAAGAHSGDTASASLAIINDAAVEGSETAILGASVGADGTGGQVTIATDATAGHTVTIIDNDTATVGFAAATSSVGEGVTDALGVVLTITADGTGTPILERAVSFNVITASGGTATGGGVDYTLPGTVSFPSGAVSGTTVTANLVTANDMLSEGFETANLGLAINTDGTGGQVSVDGAKGSLTDTIFDNDVDVQVTVAGPSSAPVAGSGPGNLVYTVSVKNVGLTDATHVTLDELFSLPAGVSFVSGSSAAGTFTPDMNGTGGSLDITSLPKNATATFTLTFTADASTADQAQVDLTSTASSSQQTLVNTNDDSATGTVNVVRRTDLAVTLTDVPDPVGPDHDLTYHLHLVNSGPSDASFVSLVQNLPQHATFVSATGPVSFTSSHTTTTATFGIASFAAGAAADFTVVVHTAANSRGLTLSSSASVSETETDLIPGNNSDSENTLVAQTLYAVANSQPTTKIVGTPPMVRVFDGTGQLTANFLAYESTYDQGVRIAIGDLTGDGVDDVVTATTNGTGRIRIFDGVTHLQTALGGQLELAAFTGPKEAGAYVALADVDGDHHLDIVAGSGLTGGKVKVFSGVDGHLLRTDSPFGTAYTGQVRVAAADLDGDGQADIVSGQGAGGKVNVDFSGIRPDLNFTAGGALTDGIFVATGDTTGDGVAEIIVGRGHLGTSTNASIGIYRINTAAANAYALQIKTIALSSQTYNYSARVAATDLDNDGIAEIIVAPNYRGQSSVQIFDGATGQKESGFAAFPANPDLGVFVAASVPRS